jgi:hypothetical protein
MGGNHPEPRRDCEPGTIAPRRYSAVALAVGWIGRIGRKLRIGTSAVGCVVDRAELGKGGGLLYFAPLVAPAGQIAGNLPGNIPPHSAELWPQLFSDVNCIALWISSEKILTRLYSVLHWFHKRLEVNVKNPRENRCVQNVIVFSFGSVDNSNKCTVLWKIAVRVITVSTSVNNELRVKLSS